MRLVRTGALRKTSNIEVALRAGTSMFIAHCSPVALWNALCPEAVLRPTMHLGPSSSAHKLTVHVHLVLVALLVRCVVHAILRVSPVGQFVE